MGTSVEHNISFHFLKIQINFILETQQKILLREDLYQKVAMSNNHLRRVSCRSIKNFRWNPFNFRNLKVPDVGTRNSCRKISHESLFRPKVSVQICEKEETSNWALMPKFRCLLILILYFQFKYYHKNSLKKQTWFFFQFSNVSWYSKCREGRNIDCAQSIHT